MFYECIFPIYWFPKLSASYYIVSQYVTDQKASKLIKCGRCRAAGYAIFYIPCTFNYIFHHIILFLLHIIYIFITHSIYLYYINIFLFLLHVAAMQLFVYFQLYIIYISLYYYICMLQICDFLSKFCVFFHLML